MTTNTQAGDEELREYINGMFRMVWIDSQDTRNDKDMVKICESATNMVLNRSEQLIKSKQLEARIDERGLTANKIRDAILNDPSAEIETGQYDEFGRCELEGYVTISRDPFEKIIATQGNDKDYITIPLSEWEKYIAPHIANKGDN